MVPLKDDRPSGPGLLRPSGLLSFPPTYQEPADCSVQAADIIERKK